MKKGGESPTQQDCGNPKETNERHGVCNKIAKTRVIRYCSNIDSNSAPDLFSAEQKGYGDDGYRQPQQVGGPADELRPQRREGLQDFCIEGNGQIDYLGKKQRSQTQVGDITRELRRGNSYGW